MAALAGHSEGEFKPGVVFLAVLQIRKVENGDGAIATIASPPLPSART